MAESLDATFFALRKRERGGVLMGASFAFMIGAAILIGAFIALMWSSIGPLLSWYTELLSVASKGDSAGMSAATSPPAGIFMLGPVYLLFMLFYFILLASFEAACLRWMIRGETGGVMGLTLGADTWRTYATYWVWFFLVIGVYIGLFIVAFLIGAVGGATGGESAAGATVGVVLLGVLAYLLAWLYVAVRLAPAAATSVGVGRFSFFKAWSVTSGRFWAMFGAFLLLIVIAIVVSIVTSTIFMSVFMAGVFANVDWMSMSDNPEAIAEAYLQSLSQVFSNPALLASFVAAQLVSWAVQIAFYVMFYGVNARAVQAALAEGKIQVAPAT